MAKCIFWCWAENNKPLKTVKNHHNPAVKVHLLPRKITKVFLPDDVVMSLWHTCPCYWSRPVTSHLYLSQSPGWRAAKVCLSQTPASLSSALLPSDAEDSAPAASPACCFYSLVHLLWTWTHVLTECCGLTRHWGCFQIFTQLRTSQSTMTNTWGLKSWKTEDRSDSHETAVFTWITVLMCRTTKSRLDLKRCHVHRQVLLLSYHSRHIYRCFNSVFCKIFLQLTNM